MMIQAGQEKLTANLPFQTIKVHYGVSGVPCPPTASLIIFLPHHRSCQSVVVQEGRNCNFKIVTEAEFLFQNLIFLKKLIIS